MKAQQKQKIVFFELIRYCFFTNSSQDQVAIQIIITFHITEVKEFLTVA